MFRLLYHNSDPGIREFFLVESGIQLKESGIPLTIGIRHNESTEWNPESKNSLHYLTWGDLLALEIINPDFFVVFLSEQQ